MKYRNPERTPVIAATLAALTLTLSPVFAGVGGVEDCAAVGRKVKSAIAQDPSKTLVVVEDALTANEDCACEIVKGAILGAEADNELVKQIVVTAVTTVEAKAAEIAECAVATAPDSAKYVKAGLEAALGEMVAASGKSAPFVGSPISTNGIFLVPPVAPPAASATGP